jgi:hypothetical protein
MKYPIGQQAYEADLKRYPTYHDGSPRPAWEKLPALARMIWKACATLAALLDDGEGER